MASGQKQPSALLGEALCAQHWARPALYVVATPIGNLADISPRALNALQQADAIACEDTRTSRALLQAWHIDRPLLAAHQHNEAQMAARIVGLLKDGQNVALISDAGSPAVSDPGARIVQAVHEAGFQVVPIPGASAVITLLMACGLTSDDNPAFSFAGFVPPRAGERLQWLQHWLGMPHTVVFFESPHRILSCAKTLAEHFDPDREAAVGRELTKQFEEIARLRIGELPAWVEANRYRSKGEFALAIAPARNTGGGSNAQAHELVEKLLEAGVSVRDAARIAAGTFEISRDEAYEYALSLRRLE